MGKKLQLSGRYIAGAPNWAKNALLVLFFLLIFRFFVPVPTFSGDDGYHLWLVGQGDILNYLYRPEFYQRLSCAHLSLFSIPYYALIQAFVQFSPAFFRDAYLLLLGIWLVVTCRWLEQGFRLSSAGQLIFIGVIFTLGSVGSLSGKYYTEHYLLGGIAWTLGMLAFIACERSKSALYFVAGVTGLLVAVLSKEIFLPALGLSIALCFRDSWLRYRHLAAVAGLLVIYFLIRHALLGTTLGGRTVELSIFDNLAAIRSALPGFVAWYATTHTLLLLLIAGGFAFAPRHTLLGVGISVLLATPSLGAVHAFQQPTLHADRLFITMNWGLAATIAITYSRAILNNARLVVPLGSTLAFAVGVGVAWNVVNTRESVAMEQASPQARITRQILDLGRDYSAIYLPENYDNGPLVKALARAAGEGRKTSANCLEALDWSTEGAIYFDTEGMRIGREELAARCHRGTAPMGKIGGEVHFKSGVLEWNLAATAVKATGIYFPEYAIGIPSVNLSERIIRPIPGATYQVFRREGDYWWFSDPRPILFK